MPSSSVRRYGVPVVAGAALFVVNNFLLARILTRLPGGTMLAVTDLVTVALVVSRRRFPSITIIYTTYAVLAVLGHVGVDAVAYLRHIPTVVTAALVFDIVVALGRYRWPGLALGLLAFAAIVSFMQRTSTTAPRFLAALALAYAGLALGLLVRRLVTGKGPA